MCTPTKDQVIQEIRQHLNAANHWVLQRKPPRDVYWTSPIKTALCNACHAAWGACNPISIRATGVGPRDPNDWVYYNGLVPVPHDRPNCAAGYGEWLYDVTCLQQEGSWHTPLQRVLLVAEVEWGGQRKILEDFSKLLLARSEIRVMVCNDFIGFDTLLADRIHRCQDTRPNDTYLLAAFGAVPNVPRIVYYRIDAHQGQCELDPIPSDYYNGGG